MRPPDLPGGNGHHAGLGRVAKQVGFNEAAGFTRRKPDIGMTSMIIGSWLQ